MKVSTVIIPAKRFQISATRKSVYSTAFKLRICAGGLILGTTLIAYYTNTLQDIKQQEAEQTQQYERARDRQQVIQQPVHAPVSPTAEVSKPIKFQPIEQTIEITSASTSTLQTALTDWVKQNRKSGIKLNDALTKQMVTIIFQKCVEKNVDPFLFLALVKVESGFDVMAVSPVGARGLTQIMPQVHKDKLVGVNVYDPEINLDRGIQILAEYRRWHKGNNTNALLQYNGSLKHDKPTYARQVYAERSKIINFVQEKILQSMKLNTKAVKVSIRVDQIEDDHD